MILRTLILLTCLAPASAAVLNFSLDTTPLNLGASGTYLFQLTSITPATTQIDFSGGSTILVDNSFFEEYSVSFVPGGIVSFSLDLNFTVDPDPTPDNLSFFILDEFGFAVPTADPIGANALFSVDLDGSGLINAYTAFGSFDVDPVITYTADPPPTNEVPEPSTFAAMAVAIGLIVRLKRS